MLWKYSGIRYNESTIFSQFLQLEVRLGYVLAHLDLNDKDVMVRPEYFWHLGI